MDRGHIQISKGDGRGGGAETIATGRENATYGVSVAHEALDIDVGGGRALGLLLALLGSRHGDGDGELWCLVMVQADGFSGRKPEFLGDSRMQRFLGRGGEAQGLL